MKLRPFQRRFLSAAFSPAVDTACLSLPRGNGKSALAAHIVSRVLDPADPLFRPGTESVVAAASLEQGRIVYRFVREVLEPRGGYRWLDSGTRIAIVHKATNTRLRVIGSNAKGAMGLVGCPWVIADEPGAWEVNGGTLMYDAIQTAQGKPGSPLKAVYIGTLAPSLSGSGGMTWWRRLARLAVRSSAAGRPGGSVAGHARDSPGEPPDRDIAGVLREAPRGARRSAARLPAESAILALPTQRANRR